MTMTFVVMGLGTVFNALTNRRDPTSGLTAPILQALAISLVPVAMIVLATQLPGLQAGLLTTSLTGLQWLECVGLALLLPLVIEVSKWIRRRRARVAVVDAQRPRSTGRDRAVRPAWVARGHSAHSVGRNPGDDRGRPAAAVPAEAPAESTVGDPAGDGDVRAGRGHLVDERVDRRGGRRPGHHGQRRPVGDRAGGAGLGRVHPDRQQGRRPDRPQAGLRAGSARLRGRRRWR